MKFRLLFIVLFISSIALAQNKGTLSGVLTDKESNNATLPFANIVIKGKGISTSSDADGKYSINLEPGNYVVQFSFLGYENIEAPFTIVAGETTTINKAMGSGSFQLTDVVVTSKSGSREKESALLLEQKNAIEIKQSIGAQEMARKGVSDVEEGLTKITGITKVDGRGLFVRGLEDRYNNLLINDLQAPSNSPFTKIIPLDLFPTDIVGVLNVYKTFNPNIPGDFAGATVNIETSQAKSITKLNVGFGYTTANNGSEFLIHSDANNTQGLLGFNGSDRKLSAAFGNIPSGKKLTPQQYNVAYKNNTWDVDEITSPINSSVGFIHAEKISLKNNDNLNYILSLNSENKYIIRKGVNRTFILGAGDYDNNFKQETYNYQTSTSALIGLKYINNRFDIASNTFYLKSTDTKIQDQLGYTANQSSNPNILIRTNQFDQTDYLNSQLLGNFKITSDEKHTLKAGGSFVKTGYQQPDRKFIIGEKVSETEINMSYGGNNLNRQYLDIKGNYYVSGLLEYNFKFKETLNGKSDKLAFGYNVFNNNLSSIYRIFSGQRAINKNFTAPLNSIDQAIINDVNNGIVFVKEESNSDYRVNFDQIVNAGYANAFFNIGNKIELNGGLRTESSNRIIKYRPIGSIINGPYKEINENKLIVLPSVNAKYELTEKSNIRFSGSITNTRPITMELLPIQYISPDGTSKLGNPNLKNSENYNIDFKYELFPSNSELLAVGVFGKQINNPIETVFKGGAGGSGQLITYVNSKEAKLFGAEIEFLLQLKRISKSLSDFSFGLNTSLMKTNVNVEYGSSSLENNPSRRLQGASEWVVNSDLKYEFEFKKEMKNTISLVYSVYGDRIYAVGTAGTDHIIEKPFQKLDFIWASKISKNFDVKLAVDNLLNPTYKKELGQDSRITINESSLLLESYKRGRGFSLNLSYTF